MTRSALARLLVAALLLASTGSCDERRDTPIRLQLPATVAPGSLSRVELRVYEGLDRGCALLAAALERSCSTGCVGGFPFDAGFDDHVESVIIVIQAGAMTAPVDLPVDADGPWSVIVVADRDGDRPLYGCARVPAAEADTEVPLGYDWCEAVAETCESCAAGMVDGMHECFHPACRVTKDCSALTADPLLEPRTDPEASACRVPSSTVLYFQHAGTDCDVESEGFAAGGECRPAIIDCTRRLDEGSVSADGTCPELEMCAVTRDGVVDLADVDCDGEPPTPCECTDDAVCTVNGCLGKYDCGASECVPDDAVDRPDGCNGVDDDCDATVDEDGRAACEDQSSTNYCLNGTCVCGRNPACAAGEICCGFLALGRCVDPNADDLNCGGCEIECQDDEVCESGQCLSRDLVLMMLR